MLYESSLIDSRKSMHLSTLEAVIRAETGSKIRSFLYQLSEGVTDYRSIHSLRAGKRSCLIRTGNQTSNRSLTRCRN